MAICTQCGAIIHNDDAKNHVCESSDIPQKGQVNRKTANFQAIESIQK